MPVPLVVAEGMSSESAASNSKLDDGGGDDMPSPLASPDDNPVEETATASEAAEKEGATTSKSKSTSATPWANNEQLKYMMKTMSDMCGEMSRMQREMDYRLLRIETLESKCYHMQREIDDLKRRERMSGGGGVGAVGAVSSSKKQKAAANDNGVQARHAAIAQAQQIAAEARTASAYNAWMASCSAAATSATTKGNQSKSSSTTRKTLTTTNRKTALSFSSQGLITGQIQPSEEEILAIIENRRQKQQWPLLRRRAAQFDNSPDLQRLRLFSTGKFIRHDPIAREKTATNTTGQLSCCLCSTNTESKKGRWYCGLCHVPLCKVRRNGEKSCFEAWHEVEDLGEERMRRMEDSDRRGEERRKRKRMKEENGLEEDGVEEEKEEEGSDDDDDANSEDGNEEGDDV